MHAEFEKLSDAELVRRSQRGSLAAFEQLVFRYEVRIYSFVIRSCHSASNAREITQDTFVRAFQALHQFNPAKAFPPWLFTIARRKCVDHYRRFPARADEPLPVLTDDDSPDVLVQRQEERSQLWRAAREKLSADQFQALWLRYAEEMELDDIAKVLGKTRTGVKVLLFRARRRLGSVLAKQAAGKAMGSALSPVRVVPAMAAKTRLPGQRLSLT